MMGNSRAIAIRLQWVKVVVALTLVASTVLTWPVWTSGRDFPLVPLVDALPDIPNLIMVSLLVVQVVLLLMIALGMNAKIGIYLWASIFLILCLFDINRLQPYTFMLGAMLFTAGWYQGRSNSESALMLMRMVVIGVYCWSGLHKLSAAWITKGFPSTFGQALGFESLPANWQWLALGVPFVEIVLALGMLVAKFRSFAAVGFCIMHAMILVMISPLFLDWNIAIVPWNVGLPMAVLLLFYNVKFSAKDIIGFKDTARLKTIYSLFFFILPTLNLVGYWPNYISFSLFSGKPEQAVILLSPEKRMQTPATFEPYIIDDIENEQSYIKVGLWAQGEMVCLPFPERFVYEKIYQSYCETYGKEGSELVLF